MFLSGTATIEEPSKQTLVTSVTEVLCDVRASPTSIFYQHCISFHHVSLCKLMPTTAETLTLIWQRVLQWSPIGPGESFFDLGGTDEQARLLFSEIAQVFSRQLPTSTLRQVPTIAGLAALLGGSIISTRS